MTTATATRTLTPLALQRELGRRAKNAKRVAKGQPKARSASWVFSRMLDADIENVLAGEIVRVEYSSGRVEFVGLKSAA